MNQRVHVHGLCVQRLTAGKRQQAMGQSRRPFCRGGCEIQETIRVRQLTGGDTTTSHVQATKDASEHIVEVVGEAASKLAHRLHLLALSQLVFKQLALSDIAASGVEKITFAHDHPVNPAILAVLSAQAVLSSTRRIAAQNLARLSDVVRMDKRIECSAHQLVLVPAEEPRPSWVDRTVATILTDHPYE